METKPGSRSKEVDSYIARAPRAVQRRLQEVRGAIRDVAPDAVELISYSMPGYSYPGYTYKGMFAWFASQNGYIGLYLRPPTIQNHRRDLEGYKTTKSAVHLPLDRELPTGLIKSLVKASLTIMRKSG